MSRIDEALRLNGGGAATQPAADQPLFRPAWSLEERSARTVEPAAEPPSDRLAERPVHRGARRDAVLSFASTWRERLASGPDGNPGLVEQYRRLAATLHHAQQANGLRAVMVTSAVPGDGKTLTAVNLALVLAESYRAEVLLIDADLRRPSIPSVVDLGEGRGLSEALRSATEQKLALASLAPTLTLLPAGQPIANSIEALTSPRMRQILDEARSRFDWVILDAPPVGVTADARLLAQMVDGTLFVIHAGKTQYPAIKKAIDALGREQLLGVVLNGVDADPAGDQHYYYGATRAEK